MQGIELKKVVGLSKRGPAHIKNKLPNQDNYLCYQSRNFALIVVSDGLGSKSFSHIGSRGACKAVLQATKCFVKNKTTTSIKDFFEMISSFWESNLYGHKAEDCSATCLFVLATKNRIFVARLGDGMICAVGKSSDKDKVFSDAKKGCFSNETYSLSNSNLLTVWEYESLPIDDYSSVLIATDGISADIESGKEIDFSKELIESLHGKFYFAKKRILSQLMKKWPVPKHSDDKTIAIMEFTK